MQSLVKYLVEGLAVAAAAFYIPKKTSNLKEIAMIAVTAAAVFAILDQFTPTVSAGARQGAGFGIGYNITSGLEGFDDHDEDDTMDEPSMDDITDDEDDEDDDSMDTDTDTDMDMDMDDTP